MAYNLSIFVFSRTKLSVIKIKQYHRNSELEGMHKSHHLEYTTYMKYWNFLELLELLWLIISYTISYLFLVLYSRKKPSDRVRNKIYLEFHEQNLKHLFTSGCFLRACGWRRLATFLSMPLLVSMCMLGVTKFQMIVSLPNSPLSQVSNLKIQVFQRIRCGAYWTISFYAEIFPPNVWGKESDIILSHF